MTGRWAAAVSCLTVAGCFLAHGEAPDGDEPRVACFSYRWDHTFEGSTNGAADRIARLAVHADGHVYLLTGTERDFALEAPAHTVLLALGTAGERRWQRTIEPESGGAAAIAVDGAGNVYLAGRFRGEIDLGGGPRHSGRAVSLFVVSFGADGEYRWDRTFGAESGLTRSEAIAIDAAGNLYLTGSFCRAVDFGGGTRTTASWDACNIFVLSLGPRGAYRWDRTFESGGTETNVGSGIALDDAGHIYLSGHFQETDFGGGPRRSDGQRSVFVASYGADGSYRWDRTAEDRVQSSSRGLAVDPAGTVYVVGDFARSVDLGGGLRTSDHTDGFIVSYDSNGAYRWDRAFGGTPSAPVVSRTNLRDVTVGGDGAVYVTGFFRGAADLGGGVLTSAGSDMIVASYEPDATHRWDRTIGSRGPEVHGTSIAMDGAGNLHAAGGFAGEVDFGGGPRTSLYPDPFVVSLEPCD